MISLISKKSAFYETSTYCNCAKINSARKYEFGQCASGFNNNETWLKKTVYNKENQKDHRENHKKKKEKRKIEDQ